jgi:signal transduction histidine kinase
MYKSMQAFLANNCDELIARCKAKVAKRPLRAATYEQVETGIPMFLGQLMKTLLAEEAGRSDDSLKISGASGGNGSALSEIGISAQAHGKDLLSLGYTVDQVVHDYGDLCQAITDLAFEKDTPFTIDEFRTLNRCLDNAIADAVTAFSDERDDEVAFQSLSEENLRTGVLVHELRNGLHTALMAFAALESGALTVGGSTGAVMKRSLDSMSAMLALAMERVRQTANLASQVQRFALTAFLHEAEKAAQLDATASASVLMVTEIDPQVQIEGNRTALLAALFNLLHNAFKFTQAGTSVSMSAYATSDRVMIHVSDHCGGLKQGVASKLFLPFTDVHRTKPGLGLGLSIARASVEADGGTLSVQDMPGHGCIFTISLPRSSPT